MKLITQFQSEEGERSKFEKHDAEEIKKIVGDKSIRAM